jgi:hypothetical protein
MQRHPQLKADLVAIQVWVVPGAPLHLDDAYHQRLWDAQDINPQFGEASIKVTLLPEM